MTIHWLRSISSSSEATEDGFSGVKIRHTGVGVDWPGPGAVHPPARQIAPIATIDSALRT
jgi:hypothetical protein